MNHPATPRNNAHHFLPSASPGAGNRSQSLALARQGGTSKHVGGSESVRAYSGRARGRWFFASALEEGARGREFFASSLEGKARSREFFASAVEEEARGRWFSASVLEEEASAVAGSPLAPRLATTSLTARSAVPFLACGEDASLPGLWCPSPDGAGRGRPAAARA